jgi:hypothetical protein
MSHRKDHWHEALVEHLENREWADIQIINLTHRIGRSALMSCEGVLEVLEYQQMIDEQIAAEKEHDRWAIGRQFSIPQSFFDRDDYEEEAAEPSFIQQRFEEQQ